MSKNNRFYLDCCCSDPFCSTVFEVSEYIDHAEGTVEKPIYVKGYNLWIHHNINHGSFFERLKAAWRLLWRGWSEEASRGDYVVGEQTMKLSNWLFEHSKEALMESAKQEATARIDARKPTPPMDRLVKESRRPDD